MTQAVNPYPRARAVEAALATASRREVAKQFGLSLSSLDHYLLIVRRLPADIIEVVENERNPARIAEFGIQVLYLIARLPTDEEKRRQFAEILARLESRA